ncbi:MAG: NAD-dependent epimerase/dehydratase family protein [Ardenticatenales bacterium]|nr:NAD-dependent epimerase/dehydratase family protein [Ardenticatenales bacterium]
MNVLVTGGAGFIGSHLVDRLLADGHHVTVIDNCVTGRPENVAQHADRPGFTFLRGSVLNETLVAAVCREVDLVFHLAAAVGVTHIVKDPLWAIVTNTRGTEIVLKRAFENRVRVVFASSSEIYGQSDAVPFDEDGPRVLGPTTIHRWAYSTSKALDEHLCWAYADKGLAVSAVRYFNIFGPRMDPAGYGSVIARFVTQALAGEPLTVHGDGRQSRCFTYVSEAVTATILAGTHDGALHEAFNIGHPQEHTIEHLAERVIALTDSPSTVTRVPYAEVYGPSFADTRRRVPDVTKAAERLGFRAHVTLDEGLAAVIAERAAAAERAR